MTWVTVVKFWAYQAHQLQLIVYTNLPLTIPGLELFSLVSKQWGSLTISSGLNFGYFNYPLLFPNKSVSAVLTHMNNSHIVYHAAIYLDSRNRCALYGENSFATDTKFYIIAIGY